jgi:photosystem II Psb27 protein
MNMKAKYRSLVKSLNKSLQGSWQIFGRSAIALALVALMVMGGFVPAANAALFAREGDTLTTKEIQTLVNAGLTGNYIADTTDTIATLRDAVNLPENAENRAAVKTSARYKINAYVSRYRADRDKSGLYSYTTMLTALNTLAGYYNGSTKRAVPAKVRDRLLQEFDRAEAALAQGR